MNYIEVTFICTPENEIYSDILSSILADIGFESFLPSDKNLVAYIQQNLYDEASLNEVIESFPIEGLSITYNTKTIEDQNWNEAWEKNYFKPLIIDDKCIIQSSFHKEPAVFDYNIVIDPKMAFGTGHHQTTELMIRQLLKANILNKDVLDMGCGTAILAILASLRGAKSILAVDIDKWAYDNAVENVNLNGTQNVEIKTGDASVLNELERIFDIILANINRNILLQDISTYSTFLKRGGLLYMSGFYKEDIALIREECEKNELKFLYSDSKENWAVVVVEKY